MKAGRGNFAAAGGLFLRLLAVIHVIAFASFWSQWRGLVGPRGILPAARFFATVKAQLGASAFVQLPSLCWWLGANHAPAFLCAAGIAAAVLLFVGIAPALCLGFLWVDYLSLVAVGQVFYEFQWDSLLLETTLLAVFLAPWSLLPRWKRHEPPPLARWLLWWLLFRLMLVSGLVKLTSGDKAWWHLTALTVHFQTQPIPTPAAWYAHHLPLGMLRGMCLVMFLIELGAPFLIWAPRRWRHVGAGLLILLQVAIAITGNYTFFNLLTAGLCILCFEGVVAAGLAEPGCGGHRPLLQRCSAQEPTTPEVRSAPSAVLWPVAILIVAFTATQEFAEFSPSLWTFARPALAAAEPLRSFNSYGLFRVMTTTRPELIFEGSNDAINWSEYVFVAQPGPLTRRPPYVAPGQPRLDWQLWFAALGPPEESPWVGNFVTRLLQGTPEVLALLGANPFPSHPPRYVRVARYDYRFSSAADKRAYGRWWDRSFIDDYLTPVTLR